MYRFVWHIDKFLGIRIRIQVYYENDKKIVKTSIFFVELYELKIRMKKKLKLDE